MAKARTIRDTSPSLSSPDAPDARNAAAMGSVRAKTASPATSEAARKALFTTALRPRSEGVGEKDSTRTRRSWEPSTSLIAAAPNIRSLPPHPILDEGDPVTFSLDVHEAQAAPRPPVTPLPAI
mmetsp:Transcript_9897/g.15832  ORF Transcript_9897/g.15832 Transcript_9897/m.15832 type:complete len:124 (-) Transcript_9897:155-526(-)